MRASVVLVENSGPRVTLAQRLAALEAQVADRGGRVDAFTVGEPRGFLKLFCPTHLLTGFYHICDQNGFEPFEIHSVPAPAKGGA